MRDPCCVDRVNYQLYFNLDRSLLLSCADDPKAESVSVFLYLAGYILTRCHSQIFYFFFFFFFFSSLPGEVC